MTHAQSDRVDVVVLTSSETAQTALRAFLVNPQPATDPDGARFEVGMLRGVAVRVALGSGTAESALFEEFTERALAYFRPAAVLVVATAVSRTVPHDTVVAATHIYSDNTSNSLDRGDISSALRKMASDLDRTPWWEGLPGDTGSRRVAAVHFGPVISASARHVVREPIPSEFLDALASDSGEAKGATMAARRVNVPIQVICSVADPVRASREVLTGGIPLTEAFAARFAMTLAAGLGPAGDVVRQLKTMGHGDRVARTDLLARHAFVESLAELLAHSAPSGSDEDLAGPTVIAIEGAWGTGKSTLMEMTRARLDSEATIPTQRGVWAEAVERWRQRKLRAWEADFTLSGWVRRPKRVVQVAAPRVLTATFNAWSSQASEHVWAGLNDCIVSKIVGMGAPVIAPNSSSSLKRFWFAHNVERLDRGHVQRTLRKRIVSPMLRLGVFALPVPLLAQLVRAPAPFRVFGFEFAPGNLALWIIGIMLGIGLLHTSRRYMCRAADTLLPVELFGSSGAIGAYSTAVGTDDPLRDPLRRDRKGPLQSAQEDVHRLIRELGEQRTQLVVFIDDLDRCSPRITAEVFEAINGFLSGAFPSIRFVLGIDAAATAAHLDAAYSKLVVAEAGRDPADPSPGWTFLRKLIQLPVPLPQVAKKQIAPLLDGLLGTPSAAPPEEVEHLPPFVQIKAEVNVPEPKAVHTAPAVPMLEQDEQVKERFAERLYAQPDLSVREAKRIVTVWMFYIRVLDRLRPEVGLAAVRRACHLVLLAEIIARWPASLRCVFRRIEGRHGLGALADAVDDNVQWEIEIQRFGLTGDRHKSFRTGVRTILKDYDGAKIATLAQQLT